MTPEEETFNKLKEPAPVINAYGDRRWYNEKGQKHRDHDLPAVIYNDGIRLWYKNGKMHREDGPAVIWSDGKEAYWENGVRIK